ncbi:beta-propeller domain-containing protein [Bacillus horti]|uniref:Secreted protein with C-terminal beta-propeller domain n=1 Tax=Caldalkalibacillus horti TaxID=77523 RepID=A0ABT9W3T2_9BACI|nr:beta-propeller domain-containing protein [Bacillus horti]MDQ0167505.1 putative secreted protein with C-terminal beta-propeller domain [Bacillus horti]
MSDKQIRRKSILLLTVGVSVLTMVLLLFIVEQPPSPSHSTTSNPDTLQTQVPDVQLLNASSQGLPVVGSQEQLYELVKKVYDDQKEPWFKNLFGRTFNQNDSSGAEEESGAIADTAANSSEFAETNLQVAGVDEADIVKTDGQNVYSFRQSNTGQSSLLVSRVYPIEDMSILQEVEYEEYFYPFSMYVDEQHLVVIGQEYLPYIAQGYDNDTEQATENVARDLISPAGHSMTKVIVYNRDNSGKLQTERELEFEGSYLSSRKIDKDIYVLTNEYLSYVEPRTGRLKETIAPPTYRDTSISEDYHYISYDQMFYFPDPSMNYLNVAGFSLDKPEQPVDLNAYLGGGQDIYGTKEHLFVTQSNYRTLDSTLDSNAVSADMAVSRPFFGGGVESTTIYKFAWKEGRTEFITQGDVPGRMLNQFSMDEHNGHLRIATTSGDMWAEDENQSENHLFVMDHQLQIVGQIDGIAPGEQIYSARFMGDRAYMVTFRTVDPLFVLDLQDPTQPTVLGELKIPGFSNYLHPYDENHVIGFGMDTEEFVETDWQGNEREMAIQTGVKLTLFDITDPNQPKEKFVEKIGDQGTYSDLNHNHKALLFSKERDIFAFPIQVYKALPNNTNKSPWQETKFDYQGIYIYGINSDQGFQLKGKISQMSQEQIQNNPWDHYDRWIQRALYIEDTVYTISNGRIQANDLNSLDLLNTLDMK